MIFITIALNLAVLGFAVWLWKAGNRALNEANQQLDHALEMNTKSIKAISDSTKAYKDATKFKTEAYAKMKTLAADNAMKDEYIAVLMRALRANNIELPTLAFTEH